MKTFVLSILLTATASGLPAWGELGHLIVSEAATYGCPSEMPPFFHRAYPQLIYLSFDPDRLRGSGPSFDAFNPPNHFLDWEYVSGLTLPADRYDYLALLDSSGTLERNGIRNTIPGFAPWQIAELSEALTSQWRLWRVSDSGSTERLQIEQNIIQTAGVLAHFAGDVSNPHHTTINYNGWVEPNPRGFRNTCEEHARFETEFISRFMVLADVIPLLSEPRRLTSYFDSALEVIRESNLLIEAVYAIDRDGGFEGARPPLIATRFASHRLGVAASFVRDLWWSAYVSSAEKKPRRRGGS